ncbi:hypothetical protein KKA14_12625 [bacterium]|nr:hypothetical protein [bacterium]
MVRVKQFLIYAIGLIAGTFCGNWASQIASETLGIRGAAFVSNKMIIPTNIAGAIEFFVIIVVFLVTVGLIERSGFLK